jgi:hypothetical protein
MDDTEKQPMPVLEKTVQQPPPLPAGSILTGTDKPAAAPAAVIPPATSHAIAAVQAAAKMVQALPDQTRNVQQALRMLNDAMGLLQKG